MMQQQRKDLQALQRQIANQASNYQPEKAATHHGATNHGGFKKERYSPTVAQGMNGPPPQLASGANSTPVGATNQQLPMYPRPVTSATVTNTSFTDTQRQSTLRNGTCHACGIGGHFVKDWLDSDATPGPNRREMVPLVHRGSGTSKAIDKPSPCSHHCLRLH